MKNKINVYTFKCCAFCKYWYDPINLHIEPITPNIGIWAYDMSAKCKCLKYNALKAATLKCSYFESKIS